MPHDDHAHAVLPSDPALRVKALETLLVEKGLVDPKALEVLQEKFFRVISHGFSLPKEFVSILFSVS